MQRFYERQGLKPFRNYSIMIYNKPATKEVEKEKEVAAEPPKAEVPQEIIPASAAAAGRRMTILVMGAHIGDAEITGGLLATKYARAGHRVVMLHMTAGEKGNPRMDDQVYRAQRIKEAEASAAIFGAERCIVLDHKDGELQAEQATFLQVCDIVREEKPDIIFTHWRGSFHRDHRNTYTASMEGSFLAALPGIKRELPAHCIRGLYYLENWEDMEDFKPDFWVDIDTETYDAWVRGCQAHQLLRGEVSFQYLQYYCGLAAKRGAEVGKKFAVCVSLPPISRKRRVDFLPVDTEPVLVF